MPPSSGLSSSDASLGNELLNLEDINLDLATKHNIFDL
jgi:hypothetical protein